jgi:hypothetical protein
MTNVTAPAVVPETYFANTSEASQARHAKFAATVSQLEAVRPAATPAPNAPATAGESVAAPDENALAIIAETAKYKDADGKPVLLTNPAFRAAIEKLRVGVFEGKPFDAAAAKTALHEALGIAPPAAPTPAAPVDGQGTPEEREQTRLDAVAERLDAGHAVPVAELPEAALFGYSVSLPDGWGLGPDDVAMLETARAANIPQKVVDQFIAARLKGEA